MKYRKHPPTQVSKHSVMDSNLYEFIRNVIKRDGERDEGSHKNCVEKQQRVKIWSGSIRSSFIVCFVCLFFSGVVNNTELL